MRAVWVVLVLILVGALGVASCRKPAAPAPAPAAQAWPAPMKVVVSIPPLKGLVAPLLPPGSTVTVLIPPGVSEHGFEIPPAQVREAINADLLVWVGGMEPAVDTLSKANPRPGRLEVRLADALGIAVHEHDHDEHGEAEKGGHEAHADHHDEHEHGAEGEAGDPHIWLDPQNAALIVKAVEAKVIAARPSDPVAEGGAGGSGHPAHWKSVGVQAELDTLDQAFRSGLEPAKARTIVVAHDAYARLAKRYALTTVAISGLTATEPTPGDLQKAKEAVRANGLKAVFTEPQISDRAAKSIAEATGVKVLSLDPLGDGDYFKMMYANLEALKQALGVGGEPTRESGPK
ncbi:MAG: metal ABC transporter substrate-binding protein [Phycisphaerales bacterium]